MRSLRSGKLRMKAAALAGAAVLATTGLAACGGDDGEASDLPPTDETLTIGIANEQPYGYMDANGEATGFAPDVARAVLGNLGYEDLEFKVVEFGQLISGINSGQFDLVAAGMYLTPDRIKQVAFSDPDYCIRESLAVKKGNPKGITDYFSIAENSDVTVAVASGTVEVNYVEKAGVPSDQVEEFKGIDQMYNSLEAGEVDAVTGTKSTVESQVKGRKGIEAVEPFWPEAAEGQGEIVLPCGGYAFNLEDQAFRDAFNEELNKLQEDGTTEELITKYPGFSSENVEQANEMTVDEFDGEEG